MERSLKRLFFGGLLVINCLRGQNVQPANNYIQSVPNEVFSGNIAQYLSQDDIAAVSQTSRQGKQYAKSAMRKLDLSNKSIDQINNALKAYAGPQLQELTISYVTGLSDMDTSLSELAGDLFKNCTGLKKLSLVGCNLTKLPPFLKYFINLKELSLDGGYFKPDTNWAILPKSIDSLDLSYNNLRAIPQGLKVLKNLTYLNIDHNFFDKENFTILNEFSKLKTVSLKNNIPAIVQRPEGISETITVNLK